MEIGEGLRRGDRRSGWVPGVVLLAAGYLLAAYQRMTAVAAANGVRDLSEIFKDKTETYLTDTWHPTESGNEVIADRMAGALASTLAEVARSGAVPGQTGTASVPCR